MSNIIHFPNFDSEESSEIALSDQRPVEVVAVANLQTLALVQQALEDARTTKNWKVAKEQIHAAVLRGQIHLVK